MTTNTNAVLDAAMSNACLSAWDNSDYSTGEMGSVHPLFSHAFELGYRAALSTAAAVPAEGWVMVPVEATVSMREAMQRGTGMSFSETKIAYNSMLAAAPKAEPVPAGEYPPLPDAAAWSVADKKGAPHFGKGWMFSPVQQLGAKLALFAADQMRAYVDADRAMRAQAAPTWEQLHAMEVTRLDRVKQTATQAAHTCTGVPDPHCNYLATCGSVCNKCGQVHRPHLFGSRPSTQAAPLPAVQQGDASPTMPKNIEMMAINRYRPVPSGVLAYKVVGGDGNRSLFSGTKDECQIVARKLTEAFLDGAHVALAAHPAAPVALGDAWRDLLWQIADALECTPCTADEVLPKVLTIAEDAARYRHLRACNSGSLVIMEITGPGDDDWIVVTEKDADIAIDMEMGARSQAKEGA